MDILSRHIRKHPDHSARRLFQRTVSAQLHLAGFIAGTVGFVVLAMASLNHPDLRHFWACLVFGLTGLAVFGTSTLYHFMNDGFQISPKFQNLLHSLDHFAIYLFIAGTYTPFVFNVIDPPWDSYLLIGVWTTAIFGIAYTIFQSRLPRLIRHRYFRTAIYVLMGWVLIIRAPEMFSKTSPLSSFLLVAGGISYTLGAVVYALKKPNPIPGWFESHEIWHVAVMLGCGFHYFLILGFYRSL